MSYDEAKAISKFLFSSTSSTGIESVKAEWRQMNQDNLTSEIYERSPNLMEIAVEVADDSDASYVLTVYLGSLLGFLWVY